MAKRIRSESPQAPRRTATPRADDAVAATGMTHESAPTAVAEPWVPTEEQIARRAYELYRERGGQDGYDLEDWLRAERELRQRRRS